MNSPVCRESWTIRVGSCVDFDRHDVTNNAASLNAAREAAKDENITTMGAPVQARACSLDGDQSMLDGELHQVWQIGDVKLVHHAAAIGFHGLR